jgi:protein tyrosine phosphatase (PTP) superfamily phosphohydrolase (DUF442 family)
MAEMFSREISLDSSPANLVYRASGLERRAVIAMIFGLLTAASVLLLVYQENRAVQYTIESTEVWSAYQVKIVQATIEEDPNLKAQYTEEQDVLRQRARDLKEKSSNVSHVVTISAYAALLLLLGAATAVLTLVANRIHGQKNAQAIVRPITKRLYDRIPRLKVAAIGAPLLILAFAIYTFAPNDSSPATSPSKNFATITIKNFGQMDNHFYRGAQPKEEEYKNLAQLGVKTIIDLRDDPLPYANKAAEAAHMRYFNIPMSDKDYPNEKSIEEFFSITKEESNWPFYVHCAGGRHRTGVVGAMYRFNHDEWNYDRAYEEMKNYDFYTRFGHGALKKYVEDYWQRLQTKTPHPS